MSTIFVSFFENYLCSINVPLVKILVYRKYVNFDDIHSKDNQYCVELRKLSKLLGMKYYQRLYNKLINNFDENIDYICLPDIDCRITINCAYKICKMINKKIECDIFLQINTHINRFYDRKTYNVMNESFLRNY